MRSEQPWGPFGLAAKACSLAGLAVIPVGGADGKRPLVRWATRSRALSPAAIAGMCRAHSAANIGIITGLSGVTVLDCDAPDAAAAMLDRCGDTPLKTGTPSGGAHLWYRANGELCANLRRDGLVVDVKGRGGFVVVPPSIRPGGPFAGRQYEFRAGSWADLSRLPTVRSGSLATCHDRQASQPAALHSAAVGRRNDMLFRALLWHARCCDSEADLQDVADTINGDYESPLLPAEVQKTVRSAWGYEQNGQNWVGRGQRAYLTQAEYQLCAGHRHGADSLLLLTKLRLSHETEAEFGISPKAMAKAKVIPTWGPQRYRNAAASLVEIGILLVTHRGGRRLGDVRHYAFALTRFSFPGPDF